jgi:hypothetical protein
MLFYLPTKTFSLCANPDSSFHAHGKRQSREKLIYSVLPERGYVSEHAQQHLNSFVNGVVLLPACKPPTF